MFVHIVDMRRISGRMCSAETGAVTRGSSARCSQAAKQPSSQHQAPGQGCVHHINTVTQHYQGVTLATLAPVNCYKSCLRKDSR